MAHGEFRSPLKQPRGVDLNDPWFQEVDLQGKMNPEVLAQTANPLELVIRRRDAERVVENIQSKTIKEEDRPAFRSAQEHFSATTRALQIQGGIMKVMEEVGERIQQPKVDEQLVVALEAMSDLFSPERAASLSNEDIQKMINVLGQVIVYLRRNDTTERGKATLMAMSRASQLLAADLNKRTHTESTYVPGIGSASVQEATAIDRQAHGAVESLTAEEEENAEAFTVSDDEDENGQKAV